MARPTRRSREAIPAAKKCQQGTLDDHPTESSRNRPCADRNSRSAISRRARRCLRSHQVGDVGTYGDCGTNMTGTPRGEQGRPIFLLQSQKHRPARDSPPALAVVAEPPLPDFRPRPLPALRQTPERWAATLRQFAARSRPFPNGQKCETIGNRNGRWHCFSSSW